MAIKYHNAGLSVLMLIVVLLASSMCQSAASNRQEIMIETELTVPLDNGFRAAVYDIVDMPQNGRANVIKVNGQYCNWNALSYSLASYRGKLITIQFSADLMRTGAGGMLLWQVNNEPDYPSVSRVDNASVEVWYHVSASQTIIPTNANPVLYLTTWENNKENTTYYFDNLSIAITEWEYTPASVLTAAGETTREGSRNYYVSADRGTDDGNGTQARPFLKIAHALYYVKPGDTVMVDSGIYHEHFKMPSGEEGKPITLTAMPDANVIITPTVPITPEWKPYRDNIYITDIGEYIDNIDATFPQLFADFYSMVEARYPNMGPSMSAIHDYKRDVAGNGTNKNTVVATQKLPVDITGARLVIWPGVNGQAAWIAFVSPVKSVNGKTVKLALDITKGDPYTGGDPYTPHAGNPFYITGALSLLDAPGEYFFDAYTGLLYFYPPWNSRPQEHRLSMRSYNNIAIHAENTSYIFIKNITVFGGGINMQNTKYSTLENCHINYAEHLYTSDYASWSVPACMIVTGSNNLISGCEFGPSAGSGIILGGENNILTNTIIHDTNYAGSDFASIFLKQSKNAEIAHNTIINSSRNHLFFEAQTTFERCIIHNNYFENHATLNSDAGPVYAWSSDGGGTEIYHNFVVCGDKNDNGSMTKLRDGLYVDNYSSNFSVHHNIVVGGLTGLRINLPNKGTQFINNTVIGAEHGIGFYGYPKDSADAQTITVTDNLFVDTKSHDITYWAAENGGQVSYNGDFVNGTIPVTRNTSRRMVSSGNMRGAIDGQYRPTSNTPDIGAIPRDGTLFPYGAHWKLGE